MKNKLVVAEGEKVWGRERGGVWDKQVQTSMYTMDKQQSLCRIAQGTLFHVLW